ncbi:MAG: transcriptional regulator [Bacillus sp. (in: firmicutes)]
MDKSFVGAFPLIMLYLLTATLLLSQSIAMFLSARKHGKNPWFWGLIGLLNFPSSAIIYYLVVIYPLKRKEKK